MFLWEEHSVLAPLSLSAITFLLEVDKLRLLTLTSTIKIIMRRHDRIKSGKYLPHVLKSFS